MHARYNSQDVVALHPSAEIAKADGNAFPLCSKNCREVIRAMDAVIEWFPCGKHEPKCYVFKRRLKVQHLQ